MSAHAAAAAPGRRRPERDTVSALFDAPEAVDRAVAALIGAGLPRDLIEVAVSPEAARRHYAGRARAPGREALRYAGIGGLTGLILGALISLILAALPGFLDPGIGAIVQLLGPNLCTVGGAALGGIIGLFVRRRPAPRHARAAEAPSAIIIVVTARSEREAATLARILARSGGREPRLEAGSDRNPA
ncbi:MAG TPA: hypothetical protein VF188_05220 [Longimicrobiales bacterium]